MTEKLESLLKDIDLILNDKFYNRNTHEYVNIIKNSKDFFIEIKSVIERLEKLEVENSKLKEVVEIIKGGTN